MKENNSIVQAEENLFEQKLPYDLKMCVFAFFNQKQLKEVAKLSKEFKKLSDVRLEQLKNKYINHVFYTIGRAIRYTENTGFTHFSNSIYKYRNEIPRKEIYESFLEKNIPEPLGLYLFKTENEACEYSRFNRGSNGRDGLSQPAIFKVIYLSEIDELEIKQKDLIINKGRNYPFIYDWLERTVKFKYFEAERFKVIPLEGTLKIHEREKGQFQIYDALNYENLNLEDLEKEVNSNRCLIC